MENDADADILELYVTIGYGDDDSFKVRMSPSIADEVRALLDEHGLAHSQAGEYSAGPELAVEAVEAFKAVGGLAALAVVISTVIRRHDGKRFVIERDGEKFEAAGFSKKAVERLLEKRAQEQAAEAERWNRAKAGLAEQKSGSDDGSR